MNERAGNAQSRVYDRALLLHGSKRNEMLTLAEIELYGVDSFADADYISIYGMPPREWYRHGIRLLGRTYAIESIGGNRSVRRFLQYAVLDFAPPAKFGGHRLRIRPAGLRTHASQPRDP